MAYNVRIFGYRGVTHLTIVLPKQFSSDTVSQLDQPYEFAGLVSVSSVAASSVADTGEKTTLLRVEVPDGQTVRYEINPPGRNVAAGNTSPSLSGKDVFAFSKGWTISLIDAAGLP